ncbi:type VI secretion system tip protein TssI/VgrG [Xanthomonas sp. NCPPB 1638]|uniref:type VI secretion system tip protein TssI/VgrG n=1 Tax=Xanthomonas TaxID=338 RepID=UPI00132EB4F8|nr:type VI secretion system tip protein TssI/VgrG [Xanthomonas cucurbitae]QHG85791.1 type VI secretion system tip protein VgrG [Xanthomonas cucurbitae]WDM75686.1 type VI secretion system tip protein VgrG [Xanthomonas cucurbitae]
MPRTITLHSDLGARLRLSRLQAHEALGQLFDYRIEALCTQPQPDLRALLGTPVAVELADDTGAQRWYHGMVASCAQAGVSVVDAIAYTVLELQLVPRPWLLTQRRDCRIYQDQSVPEIVASVLGEIGYSDVQQQLSAQYPKRSYCVQYREDDFSFISRLLEQEGIYYYFTHGRTAHTLVLCDALGAHAMRNGVDRLAYVPPGMEDRQLLGAVVSHWRGARALHTTQHGVTDYDPQQPRASLAADAQAGGADLHGVDGLVAFDYPGTHAVQGDGSRYAQVRGEAHNVQRASHQATTNACGLMVGALFGLHGHPRSAFNQEYLVLSAQTTLAASGQGSEATFSSTVQVMESRLPFRSLQRTPTPSIAGLQTAVVTGETDEDIAVDAQGRVRVTFHWASAARPHGAPSCWVRVASMWAGKGWGAMSLPRVGQEVVVSFLDGNPDRPLIVGSVYNADHTPPFALPDNKTQSGVRSRSLLGGAADFNELRFDDKAGAEEVYLRAQRDLRQDVQHDHTATVDNDQLITVKHDRKARIDNNDSVDVGKKLLLQAGEEIELVTGSARLVMKRNGEIVLSGVKILIDASSEAKTTATAIKLIANAQLQAKSPATEVAGDGTLKLSSGGMLSAEAGASATLKGPLVSIKADALVQVGGGLIMIG